MRNLQKARDFIKLLIIWMLALTCVSFTGCSINKNNEEIVKNEDLINNVESNTASDNYSNPIATMEVEFIDASGNEVSGTVKMELYKDDAPDTVANFICLANNGFYDGLTFHRIISDFIIQGGDPNGDGTGSAKISDIDSSIIKGSSDDYNYSIKGEFTDNNVENNIKFGEGIVGLARSDYSAYGMTEEGYNSGCCQFFIMNTDDTSTASYLDGAYAAFGKVIEGYDVIQEMSNVKIKTDEENTVEQSEPENAPLIKSIRVETFGKTYDIPETINSDKVSEEIQEYLNKILSYMNEE